MRSAANIFPQVYYYLASTFPFFSHKNYLANYGSSFIFNTFPYILLFTFFIVLTEIPVFLFFNCINHVTLSIIIFYVAYAYQYIYIDIYYFKRMFYSFRYYSFILKWDIVVSISDFISLSYLRFFWRAVVSIL